MSAVNINVIVLSIFFATLSATKVVLQVRLTNYVRVGSSLASV